MKKTNKLISIFIAVAMLLSMAPISAFAAEQNTVILYTNDVHCAIDDYAVLAAYKAQLEAEGNTVITVDAGDAIQGEVIGSTTEGEAIVDIMNAVGYDYAVPGNHEFDYGMEVFLDLAQNKAEYDYICSNFYDLTSNTPVLKPYAIEDFGAYQIAFVGISTPDTVTSTTPEYFKDENGNFIYGFPSYPGGLTNEDLYNSIQESVDEAIKDGADYVVAVGHAGIIGSNDGWKSSDIIANTDGIDCFIDAHSHEITEKAVYKNKNNEDVFLTSTGAKFANFGVLTIGGDNKSFELINPDNVDIETMSADAKSAYTAVKEKIDGYNEDIAYLFEEIGKSEANLIIYDSDSSRAVRKRETNAGDFVADAYRAVTGSDVAIANGGGIRAEIEAGSVTRKSLMDVNAFNNNMCVLEVTGQQIIDILEHGARKCPEELGSFFQVSGMSFEIHTYRKTPVITDQLGNFIGVDETMERRVQNVCVGDEPIVLNKNYTLTGSTYVLLQGGDGLTMLDGARVLQQEGLPCDSEMLIEYFVETLEGKITAEKYGNPDGEGRITIIDDNLNAPDCDYEIEFGDTLTITAESSDGVFVKFVPEKSGKYIFRTESDGVDTGAYLFDANGEELFGEYQDDTEEGFDFRLEYEFEAGKVYYLNIITYSEGAETFELIIECGHKFEEGSCVICGETCDHTEIGFLGYCFCGENFLGKDISIGNEYSLENEAAYETFWFRFTPEVGGYYSFKSASENADPDCSLYYADGEWLADSFDVNGLDFDLVYYFEAGETYYFDTHNCYTAGIFTVNLNRIIHTADNDSEHDIEFVEGVYSNCTEHGYTDGLYCNDCEEFIYGHEELPLDEGYHIDDDYDEICDLCGKENIYDEEMCSHICHSDHWFWRFIWTIGNFIHSLLGVSPVCECGEAHY
ncbi:MAG: 5'-nucleotidase C-terminal domain-containing protein [Clostridia bacterium]|nr:5'-nucleotidase C-terminal domain-containing protein [Clostridia bacterium]